jgi:MFS family permease
VALQGIVKSFEDPARRTAILDLVGAERLVNAMSLDVVTNTLGKMLGPLAGGVVSEHLGFVGAYACVLVLHVVTLGLTMCLRIPPVQRERLDEPLWHGLAMAVRYARQSPMLVGLLYVTVVMNALAFPARQFIPAIGSDLLGVGAGLVGLLAAAESVGQLASAGLIACTQRLQYHGRLFLGGSLLVLLTGMLFVWSPWYALAFALLALGTLAMGLMAMTYTIQSAIALSALGGLLLLVPAVILTPLHRQRLTSLPVQSV